MNTERLTSVTHDLLVSESAKWLERKGCAVVISEMSHGQSETPDAIGWKGTHSILVECKTSRSDFRADALKFFRRYPERGMGQARYFCAMRGLLRVDELPPGWGLLEWDGKKLKVAKEPDGTPTVDLGARSEISLLLSALRRTGAHKASVKYYTMEPKNRAVLTVDVNESDWCI